MFSFCVYVCAALSWCMPQVVSIKNANSARDISKTPERNTSGRRGTYIDVTLFNKMKNAKTQRTTYKLEIFLPLGIVVYREQGKCYRP